MVVSCQALDILNWILLDILYIALDIIAVHQSSNNNTYWF
jgi:hypothetical protein